MTSSQPPLEPRHARALSNHRLSKPRTINSSSSSLTLKSMGTDNESDSPPTVATSNGEKLEAVVVSTGGESRSRRNSRHKIKAHIFGSSQESLEAEPEDENETRKSFADTARGVRDRLSRTGSIVSRRASLRLSISPLNGSQSRLSLVPEAASLYDLEDSDRIIDQIKEKAFYDNLAALNHVSSPVGEDMHVDAVLSPIRRRSLYTPGLATRAPDDILRKPPPPQRVQSEADREYYYNPNHSESSPLSALASLDLAYPPRFSSPVQRASTPSDSDYAHLGGLRLGTLRIMNGTSSPVPRLGSPATSPSSKLQEDYFTSADGRHNDDSRLTQALRAIHRRSRELVDNVDNPGSSKFYDGDIERIGRAPWTLNGGDSARRSGSPLKHQTEYSNMSEEREQTNSSLRQPRPAPLIELTGSDYATRVAQVYMAELPDSPFAVPQSFGTPVLSLQPTSKANEFEDKLFEEEESEVVSIMDRPRPRTHKRVRSNLETRDQGFTQADKLGNPVAANASDRSELLAPTDGYASSNSDLAKPDSGYSSCESTKSSRRKPVPIREEDAPLRPALRSSLKASAVPAGPREMAQRTTSSSLPPPPCPWMITEPNAMLENGTPSSSTQNSSDTVPTVASTSSSTTRGSTLPRKLKKLRPLSLPPPVNSIVVQSYREIDQSKIPPVTPEVASRHEERLRNFPSLEHTFPSSHHTDLRESPSSPNLVFVPIRFPSPKHAPKDDYFSGVFEMDEDKASVDGHQQQIENLKHTSQSSRPGPERRSSQVRQSEEFSIADFGDVTASLGGSAYDVARYKIGTNPRASRNSTQVHPHQMTTVRPRIKASMTEEQAAEFARLRSQHRSQSLSRIELASLGLVSEPSPEGKQRPISMLVNNPPSRPAPIPHSTVTRVEYQSPVPSLLENPPIRPAPPPPSRGRPISRYTFNDRGGVPGKMPKPKTLAVPPMPPLPNSVQDGQEQKTFMSASTQTSGLVQSQNLRCANCGHSEFVESDPAWEAQRQAWSEHRQSAVEGNQMANPSETESATRSSSQRPAASDLLQVPQFNARPTRVAPTPPQNVSSANSTASPGRFDGGLSFGYEPGHGVGGSAGTRNMKTGASRKSVEVSRGYGLDLSDVPIFVAPTS
ncbi:hypothetical protein MMC30_004684 [Trapelia coarctata]|nr:hypothetical protein [Trapelia coarctata]